MKGLPFDSTTILFDFQWLPGLRRRVPEKGMGDDGDDD